MRKVSDYFIADNVVMTGDVKIGSHSCVWFNTVIRGDVAPISIGSRVNIQDGCVLHCRDGVPLDIEDDVTAGHHAIIHCRRVKSRSLIGMRATLLEYAEVGRRCIVAAGCVVPPGMIIPDGSVVMGVPGKVVRAITDKDLAYIDRTVETYCRLSEQYVNGAIARHSFGPQAV